jgi:hypothetical protein
VGIIAGLKNDIVRVVPQSTRNSFGAGKGRADATTVIYARVADKTESLKEPRDQVERTLQQFRTEYQSPGIKAQRVGAMRAKTGAVAEIYRFTGDRWGNTELVAYFNGKRTINFFVISSREILTP